MEIEFEQQSLFEKYNLPVTRDSRKLMSLFQASPSLRKDLPKVIKTITNKDALMIEELFTVSADGNHYILSEHLTDYSCDIQSTIALVVFLCRNFEETIQEGEINCGLFKKIISDFFDTKLESGISFYGNSFKNVFPNFMRSICDEFTKSIKRMIKRNETSLTNVLFEYVTIDENVFGKATDVFKRFNDALTSSVCDSIDDFSDQTAEEKDNRLDDVNYVFSLKWELLTSPRLYPSFSRFALNRANVGKLDVSQNKIILLLESLPTLFFTLNKEDRMNLGFTLQELTYRTLYPSNAYMYSWKDFLRATDAIENAKECLESNGVDFSFPMIFDIANNLKKTGEEWYKSYRKYIIRIKRKQNVPDSIYYACILLYQSLENDDLRCTMGEYFAKSFNFVDRIDSIFDSCSRTKRLIEECENKRQCRTFSWFYQNGVISPKELDDFLQTYYGITILLPFLSALFKNAKSLYECIFQYLKNSIKNYNKGNQTYYNGNEINFLNSLPDDWMGESLTTYGDMYRKYNFVGQDEKTSYGESNSRDLIEMVDKTIAKLKNGFRFEYACELGTQKDKASKIKEGAKDRPITVDNNKQKERSYPNWVFVNTGKAKSESDNKNANHSVSKKETGSTSKNYIVSLGCPHCKWGKHKKPKTPIIKSPIHECFCCSEVYFNDRYDEFVTLTNDEREKYFNNSHHFPLQIIIDALLISCPLLLCLAPVPGLYWMVGVSVVPAFLSIIPGQLRKMRAKKHIFNQAIKESLARCMDRDYLLVLRKHGKKLYPLDFDSCYNNKSHYNNDDEWFVGLNKMIKEVNSVPIT